MTPGGRTRYSNVVPNIPLEEAREMLARAEAIAANVRARQRMRRRVAPSGLA
jgi:hypothetical protein